MSLLSLITGVDLDAEQARGEELDRKLAALNQRALDEGKYDQDTYDLAELNRRAGETGDVNAQVGAAFKEGLSEGADNIRGTVGDAVSLPFKLIPWQVYVLGALALFWWMGGAVLLKGSLARK